MMKKRIMGVGLVLLMAIVSTTVFNIKPVKTHEWTTSELSWSPSAVTAGWHGWWFRYGTQWFQFNFTGIDTNLIDNYARVKFYLHVTNHANGEGGLDGLIDVIVNPGLTPNTTYTDVLLDNVDPDNHVYYIGDPRGSYRAYGQIDVPKSYIIAGQLIIRVVRHTDGGNAPTAPVCTEQPIDNSTTPPTVPTGVYENDDAHTVHLGVWCQDGSGGHIVTSEAGWKYVSITSDRQLLATYDVTIQAYCHTDDTPVSVNITMDGSPTGYTTPHTFTGLNETHLFTVPSTDPQGHPFIQWGTGETSTTITVTSGGTYTAYYGTAYNLTITTTTGGTTNPLPRTYTYWDGTSVNVTAIPFTGFYFDHWELDGSWNYSNPISVTMDSNHTLHAVFTYVVTIEAYCHNESAYVSVNITMDGSPTGYTTPHTFTGLNETHLFTVPSTDPQGHPFIQWGTGETSTTITVTSGGAYTAYYGTHDVAVTNVTLSKTVVGQGYCMNVTVTAENQGSLPETFHVIAYYDNLTIPTLEQWDTFWSMGDVNGDGYIDQTDVDLITQWFMYTVPPAPPECDLNGDGWVSGVDSVICTGNLGLDIWTYFGLGPPPIGMRAQRVVELYPGNQTTLTFTWNTTGVPYGNYTISATATPVPGETNTTDNTKTDGWVKVTVVGDVSGDCLVIGLDVLIVTSIANFGKTVPPLPAPHAEDPNADVDCDNMVTGLDVLIITSKENFGKGCPL